MATNHLVTLTYHGDTHDQDAGSVSLRIEANDWSTGSVAYRFAERLAEATGAHGYDVEPI